MQGTNWVQIKDKFIYAAGTKSVNTTGGAETVILSGNNLPPHNHDRGDMEISGDGLLARTYPYNLSGAFDNEPGYTTNNYMNSGSIGGVKFRASRS